MKAAKTRANETFQTKFLLVGIAVFLVFSLSTIFVLNGKCQEVIQIQKQPPKQDGSLLIHVDETSSDDEATSAQLIVPNEYEVYTTLSEGEDYSDFLPKLRDPTPRKGSNIVGIINMGNSCYANSTFQAFFRIPAIRKIVFNLESYLPRLSQDLDKRLKLIKENERFLKIKSAFSILFKEDLGPQYLVEKLKALVTEFPEGHDALKEKIEKTILNFEVLPLNKKLQLNYRMIDKISLNPERYPRRRDLLRFFLTDSLTLLDQLIALFEKILEFTPETEKSKISYLISNAKPEMETLEKLLKDNILACKDFIKIPYFAKIWKYKYNADLGAAVELLQINYLEARTRTIDINLVSKLLEILKEAEQYNLYEIGKLKAQKYKMAIEAMISNYKIVEGLKSIFHDLQTNLKGNPVKIRGDKLKLQSFPGKFLENRQEDAPEYIEVLFNAIEKVIPPEQHKHILIEKVSKKVILLEGYDDETRPDQPEFISVLTLIIKATDDYVSWYLLNFDQSMQTFLGENRILDVDSSDHKDVNGVAVKGTLVETFILQNIPKVVPIQLQRCSGSNLNNAGVFAPQKVEEVFQMPEQIDFTPYTDRESSPAGSLLYRVKSIIYHSGSCRGGHYYAYTREGDKWYCLNDSAAKRANGAEIERAMNTGYIYFYERVENLGEAE